MMKDHYGSDDELQRSRKGLARLRAAILCVMCQTGGRERGSVGVVVETCGFYNSSSSSSLSKLALGFFKVPLTDNVIILKTSTAVKGNNNNEKKDIEAVVWPLPAGTVELERAVFGVFDGKRGGDTTSGAKMLPMLPLLSLCSCHKH